MVDCGAPAQCSKYLEPHPKYLEPHPKYLEPHPKYLEPHPDGVEWLTVEPFALRIAPKVLHFDGVA